jgi:hypothetical protein
MNSITAKADYSEAAGHVLDVVHDIMSVMCPVIVYHKKMKM